MLRIAASALLVGLVASPALAQGRYDSQGVPPRYLPPAGMCRVWYDNRPERNQPGVMNCNEAERVASRDRYARVIYGPSSNRRDNRDNGWWDRSTPGYGYPDNGRYPDRNSGGYSSRSVPFRNGFDDGYEKGREDARDRDRYDPMRHSRYKSADHDYNRRYGSKDEYRVIYRDGFRSGYDEGYRASSVGVYRRR